MNDMADTILFERFASQSDPVPGPDFADVLRRARLSSGDRRDVRPQFAARRRRAVVVFAASALAVGSAAGALAYRYLGPSPGFTAGVSAFERLPPAEWPSSMPRVALERAAAHVGLSAA